MPDPLLKYALTLHQPWADLIRAGIKKIENRAWSPSPARLAPGDWFAIHAGLFYDTAGEARAAHILHRMGKPWRFRRPDPKQNSASAGAVLAVARFEGIVRSSTDPWFFGPAGWVLGEVVPIDPVRCVGSRGLWELPAPQLQDVLDAWGRARAAGVAP